MLGKILLAKLTGLLPTSPEEGPPLPQILGLKWPAKVKELLPPVPKGLADVLEKGKQGKR